MQTPDMILPHPHMAERMFVLEPLAEIMPHLLHPLLRKTILQLKEELAERYQEQLRYYAKALEQMTGKISIFALLL